MRLSSSILLLSAALLACDISSEMRDINHITRIRFGAEYESVIPAKRPLGRHDITMSEDRAPSLLVTEALLPDFMITKEAMLNNFKRGWERPLRVNPIERFRNEANGYVPEALIKPKSNEGPVARKGSEGKKKSERKKRTHAVPSNDRVKFDDSLLAAKKEKTNKEQDAKDRSANVKAWMSMGLSVDDVFTHLQGEQKVVTVLKESNLRTLQLFINQCNMKNKAKDTLLQALIRGFSNEYRLARMLSVAKENPDDKFLAATLQIQLMEGWIKNKMSVDDVFVMMKNGLDASVEEKFLMYTLADTMNTYIGLFNKAHPDDDPVNAFMYLLSVTDDDRVLALLLAEAKSMGHDVLNHELNLYSLWLIEGYDPFFIYFHLVSKLKISQLFFVNRIVGDYATFYTNNIEKRGQVLEVLTRKDDS